MSARAVHPSAGELAEQQHQVDPLDESFAHLAPGYPDTGNARDFAASVEAGFVEPVDWDAPSAPRVVDAQTGGAL